MVEFEGDRKVIEKFNEIGSQPHGNIKVKFLIANELSQVTKS